MVHTVGVVAPPIVFSNNRDRFSLTGSGLRSRIGGWGPVLASREDRAIAAARDRGRTVSFPTPISRGAECAVGRIPHHAAGIPAVMMLG